MVVLAVVTLVLSMAVSASAHGSGGSGGGEGDLEHPRHGLAELGFHGLGDFGQNTSAAVWTSDESLFAVGANSGDCAVFPPLGLGGYDPFDPPVPDDLAGFTIVDATDPADPTTASTVRFGELLSERYVGARPDGIDVAHVSTSSFDGELMVVGLAKACFPSPGGVLLFDVSDPSDPVHLGMFDHANEGYHDVELFERADLGKVFAAVVGWESDTSTPSGTQGLVQLIDVTDPSDPVLSGGWSLPDAAEQGGPDFEELCAARGPDWPACHSAHVHVSEDGQRIYSTWLDGGLIVLDVSQPSELTYAGHVHPGGLDNEGSTHGIDVLETGGRQLAIVADEDWDGPWRPGVLIEDAPDDAPVQPDESAVGYDAAYSTPLADLAPVGPHPVLRADEATNCTFIQAASTATTSGLDDWIALMPFEERECDSTGEAARNAQDLGAAGLVVVADDLFSAALAPSPVDIPVLLIDRELGQRLLDATTATTVDVEATLEHLEIDNPFGFVRIVDITHPDPSRWKQLSTFKAPHVQPGDPHPPGLFSAIEAHVGHDGRVYVSWLTNGVRVLEPQGASGQMEEVAWFAPLADDHPDDNEESEWGPHGLLTYPSNIGFEDAIPVEHPTLGETVVFGLDINRGLYVLGYDDQGDGGNPNPDPDGAQRGGPAVPTQAAASLPTTGGGWIIPGIAMFLAALTLLQRARNT